MWNKNETAWIKHSQCLSKAAYWFKWQENSHARKMRCKSKHKPQTWETLMWECWRKASWDFGKIRSDAQWKKISEDATYHRRVLRNRRHNKGSLKTVASENGTVKAQNEFHAISFISIGARLHCTNCMVYQISLMLNSIARHAHA